MTKSSLIASWVNSPVKFFWLSVNAFFLLLAFWLVSPFLKIDTSDYTHSSEYGLRLAIGLLIFIMYEGKWAFDVFAPQGLARRVSGIKTVALIIFNLLVISFIIYIVAQAAALYLQTGIQQDEANVQIEATASADFRFLKESVLPEGYQHSLPPSNAV